MGKTVITYVEFLDYVACQKILESINVSRLARVISELRCIFEE